MLHDKYTGFRIERKEEGVVLLTFDQPERMNGFGAATKRDLLEALVQLQYDKASRVVVFTGEGRAFSAGDSFGPAFWGDEATWAQARTPRIERERKDGLGTYASLRSNSQPMIRAVRELDKITIAAVNGFAIQSGLSLALACDFRIVSTEARLGSATLRMGYLPDEGGHYLLVQHLGVARALDFLLRKRIVSGEEALALGLANTCVAPNRLMPEAMDLALEMARNPQVAARLLKRAVYAAAELTYAQACEDIALRSGISDYHADAREGAQAFHEKRPPRFNQDY